MAFSGTRAEETQDERCGAAGAVRSVWALRLGGEPPQLRFRHTHRLRVLSALDSASAAFVRRAGFQHPAWTEMPRGGHFAALEAPDLLATDVTTFFRSLRGR